jgi:hypothetical protein
MLELESDGRARCRLSSAKRKPRYPLSSRASTRANLALPSSQLERRPRCRAERGRGRRDRASSQHARQVGKAKVPRCRGTRSAARPRCWSRSEHHVVDVLGVRCWQQDHNLGSLLTASCLPSNRRARCASSVPVRCAARRLVGGSGRSPACVWLLREATLGRGAGVPGAPTCRGASCRGVGAGQLLTMLAPMSCTEPSQVSSVRLHAELMLKQVSFS